MKDLHKKALEAYLEMLEIHIDTKSQYSGLHLWTEKYYETMFEIAHKIWERYVDLWGKLRDDSLENKKKRVNELISNLRENIEQYMEEEEITIWTDAMLSWLVDQLEDLEWSSKSFLHKH